MGKLRLRQGGFLKPRGAASPPSGLAPAFRVPTVGLPLPVDACLSAWFIHVAERERTPQSPQRQNHFKHKVTVKQLSRKTDLGCLVLPAQLSHSGAPSSAAARSFWSGHAVAVWQRDRCNSWRQTGVTQAMLMIYTLGCNPHRGLSCCSVTDSSLLGLASPLLALAGRGRGWTAGAHSWGEGETIPCAAVC